MTSIANIYIYIYIYIYKLIAFDLITWHILAISALTACKTFSAYSAIDHQASVTLFASAASLSYETMKMMMQRCHGRLSCCECAGAGITDAWPTRFTHCTAGPQSDIITRKFEFLTLSKLHARFARELLKLQWEVNCIYYVNSSANSICCRWS